MHPRRCHLRCGGFSAACGLRCPAPPQQQYLSMSQKDSPTNYRYLNDNTSPCCNDTRKTRSCSHEIASPFISALSSATLSGHAILNSPAAVARSVALRSLCSCHSAPTSAPPRTRRPLKWPSAQSVGSAGSSSTPPGSGSTSP